MRKIYMLIIIALNSYFLPAQKLDLIVTTNGDSIACIIDSIGSTNIYFTGWRNKEALNTYLDTRNIASHQTQFIDKKSINARHNTLYFNTKEGGIRMNGVAFNIMGATPLIGVTYDRVLGDHLIFEIGVGIPSIGMGVKIFPSVLKEQKSLFHYGITISYLNSGDNEITGAEGVFFYFPIGLSYFGNRGFHFGFDLGPAFFKQEYGTDLVPYGNIKLGKRF